MNDESPAQPDEPGPRAPRGSQDLLIYNQIFDAILGQQLLPGTKLTEEELARAKGHVQGSLALSLEDANSRMTRLGRNEITGMEHLSVDDVVAKIDAVTGSDVLDVVREGYAGPYVIGAVGPFDDDELAAYVA